MKKIIDYCDICEESYETTKCVCCECSLCKECAFSFPIKIGGHIVRHHKSFCGNCFSKIRLTNKFLQKIKEEILTELDKKIKNVRVKRSVCCNLKYEDLK